MLSENKSQNIVSTGLGPASKKASMFQNIYLLKAKFNSLPTSVVCLKHLHANRLDLD